MARIQLIFVQYLEEILLVESRFLRDVARASLRLTFHFWNYSILLAGVYGGGGRTSFTSV